MQRIGWDGRTPVNSTILQKIDTDIQQAHALGVMTRYWETPLYPIYAKQAVNQVLFQHGSDLLNADDLATAAMF